MGSCVAVKAHRSTSVRLGTNLQLILRNYIAGHEVHYESLEIEKEWAAQLLMCT